MSALIHALMARGVPSEQIERLLEHWGGIPLYVPRQLQDEHQLVVLCGRRLAEALVALYAGERIIVPLGAAWRRERQRERVRELRKAGLNNVEIARRLGMHLRQVQRLAEAS